LAPSSSNRAQWSSRKKKTTVSVASSSKNRFGNDLASARALNARVLRVLSESQVYRMDHFLGKETVQNIMVLRFANGIFEPIWNRDHIDHVEITVAETVGVERRAKFYEATGALRDMVPNHIFQLLSLIAMGPPNSFAADAVRTEKDKVLEAMRPLDGTEVRRSTVRGQYGAGIVNDVPVKAYREEPGVEPASMAETYIAMQLNVDNWRWAGVPFFPPDREEAHPPHDRDRDPQENLIAPTGDRLAY
jgi:glucose-6-phosphate 1-dehydrogenase